MHRWGSVGAVLASLALFSLAVPAGAQQTDDPGDLGIGMEVFNAGCSSCHRADGSGSGSGRSLIDIAIEEPDRAVHVMSVADGIGNMPAYADRLSEEEIDAVVSYVRLTFLSEEDLMDELPNTGFEAWLLLVGLALVGLGGVAVVAVEPAMRRLPVRSASR